MTLSAVHNTPNFLVIGDSITKGMVQVDEQQKYELNPENFIQLFTDKFNLQTLNWSVFGATIDKGLQILRRKYKRLPERPVTLLEFGGNDCNFDWPKIAEDPEGDHQPMTELSVFEEHYAKLIRQMQDVSEAVYLLDLPPLDASKFFATITRGVNANNILRFIGGHVNSIYRWQEAYSQAVCKIARRLNVPLIDIRTPFLLDRKYERLLCPDGMHPNEAGHRLIADTLAGYFSDNPV